MVLKNSKLNPLFVIWKVVFNLQLKNPPSQEKLSKCDAAWYWVKQQKKKTRWIFFSVSPSVSKTSSPNYIKNDNGNISETM